MTLFHSSIGFLKYFQLKNKDPYNINCNSEVLLILMKRANGTANVSVSHGGTQFSYWCQSIA